MEFIDDECRKRKEIPPIKNIETIEPDDCINLYGGQLCPLPEELIKFINNLFHHQIREHFQKSNFNVDSQDLMIIPFQSYENVLKKNGDYFQNLLDILSCFHTLSNDPESIFFTQDLRRTTNKACVENESVFGFKRNVVGLIANYLHENPQAQEQLRTSGRFVALLDSAKIDRNNPFILQWTIFAIRNALNNNTANQQFIRNLQKQGEIVDDELLDKIKFLR
ncbi:ataxin-10-like protein [Euroglyphus maynei]|uniref:Ataxin-10-like protein n=1 Tax=Euroglyphus maynei TaxID=6958 RepID=A0A1Y3BJ65_EURMA|nr:ataxin-10-like protein [Euroglyphus maynei]